MIEARRAKRALALVTLAAFGLVVAPLLHAELHAREAEAEREMTRLVEQLSLRGADFDDLFAQVWRLGHSGPQPIHSHGPSQERHGNGTLEHYALALLAAPPLPKPPAPPPQPEPLDDALPERPLAKAWRTPAMSQAPPYC